MADFRGLSSSDLDAVQEIIQSNKKSVAIGILMSTYDIAQRTAYDWIKRVRVMQEDKEGNKTLDGKLYGPMYVKGISTLVDDEGVAKIQWIKEDAKKSEQANGFMAAIENFVKNMDKEKAAVELDDRIFVQDMLIKYPMADMHLGLLTYQEEVGDSWSIDKAVTAFKAGVKMVMDRAPRSGVGLILDLGDMIHVADSTGKTRGHGHELDVDGRLNDIYEAAIEVIVCMIDEALKHHETVVFRKTIGNHDGDTSLALGVFLKKLYKNEPRVVIEAAPNLFWWYKFGNTLHFSTHGHTVKQRDLPEIIASDCKGVWSDCKYIYADTGHVHHQEVLETRAVKCESHNTLVPGDTYNYGSGYRAGRLLKSIIYDASYGEIGRSIVNMEMIYAKLRD